MIKPYWDDFIFLLFPTCCVVCKKALTKQEEYFCLKCFEELPTTNTHLINDENLWDKFYGVPVRGIFSWIRYTRNGAAKKILHYIKYHKHQNLAFHVGLLYGKILKEDNVLRDIDLIISIPLHKAKLKKRGFNQAAKFAEGLSQSLDIPCSDTMIVRILNTTSQTTMSKTKRLLNMDNAFALSNVDEISHKNILLVDDMITTGATIISAVDCLKEANPQNINVLSMAYSF